MKIRKYVCVESEVEIDISPQDFLSGLPSKADRKEIIFSGLNILASFVRAISDQSISEMNDAQRGMIHDFFLEQKNRFDPFKQPQGEDAVDVPLCT